MASDKVPMLAEGHRNLTDEVKRLKLERPAIIDSIEEARAHGCEEMGLYPRETTRGFYEGLGFQYVGVELRQRLD